MAGFLDKLSEWMRGTTLPSQSTPMGKAYEVAPGLTMGPAESRVTRSPIQQLPSSNGDYGNMRQEQPGFLNTISNRIASAGPGNFDLNHLLNAVPGTIYMNPNETRNIQDYNDTIRHEQAHVVQNMNPTAANQAAQNAPGYGVLANDTLRRGFSSNAQLTPSEVGAYAVTGPDWNHNDPINPSVRAPFVRGYIQNLPQGQANLMQKLYQPPQTIPSTDNALNQNRY